MFMSVPLLVSNSGCLDLAMWGTSELLKDQRAKRHQAEQMAKLEAIRRDLLQYRAPAPPRYRPYPVNGDNVGADQAEIDASMERQRRIDEAMAQRRIVREPPGPGPLRATQHSYELMEEGGYGLFPSRDPVFVDESLTIRASVADASKGDNLILRLLDGQGNIVMREVESLRQSGPFEKTYHVQNGVLHEPKLYACELFLNGDKIGTALIDVITR